MDSDVENAGIRLADVYLSGNSPLKDVQNIQGMSPRQRIRDKDDHRSGSESDQKTDMQVKFNKLVTRAKKLAGDGQVAQAMELNKRALRLHYTEKLAKRIKKMEAYLSQYGEESSEEDDSSMEHVGHGFYLFRELYSKLYQHQKEGVLWFWDLHRKRKGGILGDDMGLGKTIQVIAFLSGMFDMDKVNSVLIVMPVSVIINWEREFSKWAPGIRVTAYHGTSKKEKERALAKVQRRGGVMLTSYGLIVTSWQQISQRQGSEFIWDYVILDEGHKIKNPTKTTKGVHAVPAKNRIIMTGTPVQNNLRELWSLFDFVHQGTLLGTARTFKMEYDNPITRSRERDATAGERRLGQEMAISLKKIIDPYFLRRTKAEVTNKKVKVEEESGTTQLAKMPYLGRKNDFVIWLFLSQAQVKIYEDFLSLDSVKELLMTTKSPLVALTVLKKICDHPRLLSTRACAQLGLDGEDALNDSDNSPAGLECAANKISDIADSVLIGESGKLGVLMELLDNLKSEGHRCLVFSQSRKMLDIIEKVIKNRGHKIMRMDGTVRLMCDRDKRIQKFQTDTSYSVFLLTTQVGGVGLTLTAADRVVIFDPSWNPATDAQAVDRVFRIGQNKNVVVYRLITCGSVEEKIYRRQIFKDSITRQTTGNSANPYRYFTKGELRELFTMNDARHSKTQRQLQEMHGVDRRSDPKLDAHIAYLHALDIFGVSDHDLMFSQEHANDVDSDADQGVEKEHSNDYIQHRVQKAQELLQMESELSSTLEQRMGQHPRNCDTESRQSRPRKSPTEFFTPKIYDVPQGLGEERGRTDFQSYPVPSTIDLTVMEDQDRPIEIDLSPAKVKVKVEKTDVGNFLGMDSVIEIEDTPVKVKVEGALIKKVKIEGSTTKAKVKIEDESAYFMKQESKTRHGDSSLSSEKDEYDSCEEELPLRDSVHVTGGVDEEPAAAAALALEAADLDEVIDRIDADMSISKQAEERCQDVSRRLNATCERLEDFLPESDPEDTEQSIPGCPGDAGVEPQTVEFGRANNCDMAPPKVPNFRFRTPVKKRPLIVEEEMLISPEPSSPLIEMKAKRRRNSSNGADFLSRTLMICTSDTPESRVVASTRVEDSPDDSNTSYGDPPSATAFKDYRIADSVENTPDVQRDGSPDVLDSFCEESPRKHNNNDTPIKKNKRRSVCRKNLVIESSDDESPESRPASTELDNDACESDQDLPTIGVISVERVHVGKTASSEANGTIDLLSDENLSETDQEESMMSGEDLDESVVYGKDLDESVVSEKDLDESVVSVKDLDESVVSGKEVELNPESVLEEDYSDSDDEYDEEDSGELSQGSTEDSEDDVNVGGVDDLSPEMRSQFEECVMRGRTLYLAGELGEALANILQALEIYTDPELQALALKLHQELA